MILNFSLDQKLVRVSNAVAASQTTLSTSIVNLGQAGVVGGFDAIAFIVALNTMTAGSVLTATIQDSATNVAGNMVAVTAAKAKISQTNSANATVVQSASNAGVIFTDVGGNSSNEIFVVDAELVQLQYARLQITIATANAAFDGVFALLYRTKWKPVAIDATNGGYGLFVASS